MARLSNIGKQFFDGVGLPEAGSKLYFYESGTTTLATTYSDSAQTIPNPNPVIMDAEGRMPDIFFSGQLKGVLTDADDVMIETRDPLGQQSSVGGIGNLNDTQISNVSNEDILQYDSSDSLWKNVPNSGGGASSGTPHRYWRFQIGFDEASIIVREVDFFTGGSGFEAAERWSPGTQNDNATSPPSVSLGPNNTTTLTGSPAPITSLVNGNKGTGSRVQFTANAVGAEIAEVDIDWGAGNEKAISSMRFTGPNGVNSSITNITLFYSDDDVVYTQAAQFLTASQEFLPGGEGDTGPHLAMIRDVTGASSEAAVFDSSVRQIPPVTPYWTFDSAVRNASFSADVANRLYFAEFNTGTFIITIDASLEVDNNRVGFVYIGDASEASSGFVEINNSGASTVGFIGRTSDMARQNMEFIWKSGQWNILNCYEFLVPF